MSSTSRSTPVQERHVPELLALLPRSLLFAQLPSALLPTFLTFFHRRRLSSETFVFDEDNIDDGFSWSFIISGRVACFARPIVQASSTQHSLGTFQFRKEECLCVLQSGSAFGLSALLGQGKSLLQDTLYFAIDDCELLTITQSDYRKFLSSLNPTLSASISSHFLNQHDNAELMQKRMHSTTDVSGSCASSSSLLENARSILDAKRRKEFSDGCSTPFSHEEIATLSSFLAASSRIFHSFDLQPLQELASHLSFASAKAGDVLFKQGEQCRLSFILLNGSASVHRNTDVASLTSVKHVNAPSRSSPLNLTRPTSRSSTAESLITRSAEITTSMQFNPSARKFSPSLISSSNEFAKKEQNHENPLARQTSLFKESLSFPSTRLLKVTDFIQSFGACEALVLPSQSIPFDQPLLSPTPETVNQVSVIAKEPCDVAWLPYTLLCSTLSSFHRLPPLHDELLAAARVVPGSRDEQQIGALDSLLKSTSFFQFKQSRTRRALCQLFSYQRVDGDQLIQRQGDHSDTFYIVLSGSVSCHHDPLRTIRDTSDDAIARAPVDVSSLPSLVQEFGACQNVARPLEALNDGALISSLPRSQSFITRAPTELLCLKRADYLAACEPVSESNNANSDLIVSLMKKTDLERSSEEKALLVQALMHFHYLADIRSDLRPLALASLSLEAVEAETVILEEGSEADKMYLIISGTCAVHLADRRPKGAFKGSQALAAGSTLSLPQVTSTSHLLSPRSSNNSRVNAQGKLSVSYLSPSEVSMLYGAQAAILPASSHFGDLSFTQREENGTRSATIITIEPCLFLTLPGELVRKLHLMQSSLLKAGGEGASRHDSMSQSAISSFLSKLPLFAQLAPSLAALKRLAFQTHVRHYKQGDVVIAQGDKPELITVVVEGQLRLSRYYKVRHGKSGQVRLTGKLDESEEAVSDSPSMLDHSPQQLRQPFCTLFSPLLFAGDAFDLILPLSTVSHQCALGAFETLFSQPFSFSGTVSSATLLMLCIKRTNFVNFFGVQNKAVDALVAESLKRRAWFHHVAVEEIERQVNVRLRLSGSDQSTKSGVASANSAAMLLTLSASSLENQERMRREKILENAHSTLHHLQAIDSLDIQSVDSAMHCARLEAFVDVEKGTIEEPLSRQLARSSVQNPNEIEMIHLRDREAEALVIHSHVYSISRQGRAFDMLSSKKLGKSVKAVQHILQSNEKRQLGKSQSLNSARQLLVGHALQNPEMKHETIEEYRLRVAQTNVSAALAAPHSYSEAEKDSSRNEESLHHQLHGLISKRSVAEALELSLMPHGHLRTKHNNASRIPSCLSAPDSRPCHLPLLVSQLTTVPSIPFSTATREEIEQEMALRAKKQLQEQQQQLASKQLMQKKERRTELATDSGSQLHQTPVQHVPQLSLSLNEEFQPVDARLAANSSNNESFGGFDLNEDERMSLRTRLGSSAALVALPVPTVDELLKKIDNCCQPM